ncbi:MAG: DUF58 domain-containing protein [Chitinophagaceae bacterium]
MGIFSKKKRTIKHADVSLSATPTVAEIAARAKELDLRTRKLSMQLFSGATRSTAKGRGMSFKEVRQYQAGDDVRFIDWNVSARMGHTYSKVFEEEKELNVIVLVDVSKSNLFGTYVQSKKSQIVNLAAVLCFAAVNENNKAGMMFFSDKTEKWLPPKKSHQQVLYMVRELLAFDATATTTSIAQALDSLNATLRQRSLVFIISDFISPGFLDALRVTAKRHDLVGVQVFDKSERRLPDMGLVEMEDWESGRTLLIDTSNPIERKLYQDQFDQRYLGLKEAFKSCGAELMQVATDDDYIEKIKAFFLRR